MRTMTCDEAFNALTGPRAPDSVALDHHLATCGRCRQMHDVLAPALALFAGEAPVEPGDFGDGTAAGGSWVQSAAATGSSASAVRAADEAAWQLAGRSRRRHWRSVALPRVLRTAAVFLLGAAAAFGLSGTGANEPRPASQPAMIAGGCLWTAEDRSVDQPRAEQVILSCVACHLPATGE